MEIIYQLKMQNKLDKLLLLLEDACREDYRLTFKNPYCLQNDTYVKKRKLIRDEIHKLFSDNERSLSMNIVFSFNEVHKLMTDFAACCLETDRDLLDIGNDSEEWLDDYCLENKIECKNTINKNMKND